MDYQGIFNQVLKEINQPNSKPYIFVYGMNEHTFKHSRLFFGCTDVLDAIIQYKDLIDTMLTNVTNHFHCICIDKYNAYKDDQPYCIQLKKTIMNNHELIYDYYIIHYIQDYIYKDIYNPYRMVVNDQLEYMYRNLVNEQKQKYNVTNNYIVEFNKKITNILIRLNQLLVHKKRHKLNQQLWLNYIGPYLFVH